MSVCKCIGTTFQTRNKLFNEPQLERPITKNFINSKKEKPRKKFIKFVLP